VTRRVSARSLTSSGAVAAELAHHPSGYVLAGFVGAALAGRRRLGRLAWQDLVAVALAAAAQPFVEWGLHKLVLHGRPRRVAGRAVDPGATHRRHHETPDDVAGALLGGRYAVVDAGMVAGLVAAVGAALAPAVGAYPSRAVLTGMAAGNVGLARYEWYHLLFHSGARPRSTRRRRLRAHHLAHHHRDDTRWLGVTSDLGDRLFGTTSAAGAGVVAR
jgi:Fatty acid hydroxylase superfamily